MGLLSSLKSTATKIGLAVTKPAVIVAAGISNPIAFIKDPVKTVDDFAQQPLATQVVKGAIAGAALGSLGTIATATKSVATKVLSTTVGKVATVIAAPAVLTAAINKPKQTIETVVSTPSKILDFQTDVGEFIAEP